MCNALRYPGGLLPLSEIFNPSTPINGDSGGVVNFSGRGRPLETQKNWGTFKLNITPFNRKKLLSRHTRLFQPTQETPQTHPVNTITLNKLYLLKLKF